LHGSQPLELINFHTVAGSCAVVGFGINGVRPSGSATIVLVN